MQRFAEFGRQSSEILWRIKKTSRLKHEAFRTVPGGLKVQISSPWQAISELYGVSPKYGVILLAAGHKRVLDLPTPEGWKAELT